MLRVRDFVADALRFFPLILAAAAVLAPGRAAAQPANDNFTNAVEILDATGSISGTLVDSTVETGEPQYYIVGPNSVWYRWTAPLFGLPLSITFDTMGPSVQTVVAAYYSTNPVATVDMLNPVLSNNVPVSGCITFRPRFGETYYIQVSGNTNRFFAGDFVLNWSTNNYNGNFLLGIPPNIVSNFAGEFQFVSEFLRPSYLASEWETTRLTSRPVDPTSLQRSAQGAIVTVSRVGGSAGRALVDYRTMDEIPTNYIATTINTITNIIAFTNAMGEEFYTNQASVLNIFSNAYLPTYNLATNLGGNFFVTMSNVCGPDIFTCSFTNSSTNCVNLSTTLGCPVPPGGFFGDYFPVSGTLVFEEFETTKRFVLQVARNFTADGSKQVRLELFNPRLDAQELLNPSGIIPPTRHCTNSQANVTVVEQVNQFTAGVNFTIERFRYAVDEHAGSINVDILLPSPANGGSVMVDVFGSDDELPWNPSTGSDYATESANFYEHPVYTDGTVPVVNAQDFTAFTTTLTFAQNQPRATINIPIFDDNEVEFNEDIFIRLRGISGQPPVGPITMARVTILDNDQPAGAVDRDWNPDDVSFTTPRFNLTPGANNIVRAVAVQSDQRTVIGGDFTAYNSFPRNGIARINFDGSLDPSFDPGTGADGFVAAVASYPSVGGVNDLKVVVGGGFTSINNIQRNGVARLNEDGSLDNSFNPGRGVNGVVRSIAIQNDGKVLISGDFTQVDGVARNGVARLNNDGSVDLSFDPGTGADAIVWSVGVRDTPQTVFVPRAAEGNEFEDVNDIETGSTQGTLTVDYDFINIEDNIRVYYDGVRIFNLTTNGIGQLVIPYGPGSSTRVTIILNEGTGQPGTLWRYIARIAVPAPPRKIYIGGEFLSFNGQYRAAVARLNDDGSLDSGFDPGGGADGPVYVVAPQADGRLLIGGWFSSVDFRSRNNIARLQLNGALDLSFDPGTGPNDAVYAIALQSDSKPVIGGVFTSFNSTRRLGVARLFADGSLDTSFLDTAYNQFAGLINAYHFEPANYVNSLGLQTNGGVMIGGSFDRLGGNRAVTVTPNTPWVFPGFWFGSGPGVQTHVTGWQRADKRARYNVARLIGGYTPGPGNVEFVYNHNTTDENALELSVATRRVDGRLGTASAFTSTSPDLAQPGDFGIGTSFVLWTEDQFLDEPISVGGVNERFFVIPINDDTDIEGDEVFGLTAYNPGGSINLNGELVALGTALRRSSSVATIIDNDFKHGVFNFASANFGTNENAGTNIITVIRTNGSSGQVTVRYLTQNGTGIAGQDYVATNGTLTFASGVTTQFIRVPIINDTSVEPDETFTIVLTNATGGASLPGGAAGSTATTMATIIDNDLFSGRANFASATYATNEGAGVASITLVRLGGSVGQLSVSAAATSGTAVAGNDFTGVTNTITWVHGDIAPKTLIVPLLDDGNVEADDTVNLRIFNPSVAGAVGGVSNAVLTILNDDFYGELSFSQPIFDADERGTNVTITVVRSGGVAETVSVDYSVVNGTAVNGTDFLATGGTLTFDPGVVARSFQITILNDGLTNGERTAELVLVNFNDASPGAITEATLRIFDDESIGDPAGSLDTSFNSQAGGTNAIHSIVLQPWDENLLVAGEFRSMNRVPRNRVARLHPNGDLDATFNSGPGPNAPVRTMALQPDGRVLIGGFFTTVHNTNRNHIARLLADGSVDRFFNPGAGADNPVYALALKPDGRIVVGGAFASFNGISTPGITLLEADGAVSTSFNPGLGAGGGIVFAVAVQNDGKILIGGDFTTVNGVSRPRLARLNADGSVDLSFNAGSGPNAAVRAITVQPDGSILVGGAFTSINGTLRSSLARLDSNGTVDPLFLASLEGGNDEVSSIALQFDGKIVVLGEFTRFNGVTRNRITRLDQAGRTDPTINFGAGANEAINTAVIQPDRKIVIGGRFTAFDDQPRNLLARLHGGSISGPGALEFSAPFFDVLETAGQRTITVIRRGGLSGEVTADYATEEIPGSATPSQDYEHAVGTLFFSEGETHQTFEVPVIDDFLGEPDEFVILSLSNPTGGAALGNVPSSLLTILSDDSGLGFSSEAYTVNENVSGGAVVITVLRTGTTNGTTRVDFATTNGTAIAGLDYRATNGVLVFGPGDTVQTFTVSIINDTLIEGPQSFGVILSNATGSSAPNPAAATVTIIDDDFSAGELSFSAVSYSVNESAPEVTITILRTNGSTGAITVDYFTSDDTARAGSDYDGTGVVGLTFAEGQTSQTIRIPIRNDSRVEGNERFFINLTNASGTAIIRAPSRVPVVIVDDDIAPGSVDTSFDPGLGPNASVQSVAIQGDSKIVIGGAFTLFNNTNRPYVARLDANGPLDLTFNPGGGPNAVVSSVGILPDGRVVIGGSFSAVSGAPFNRVARLHTSGPPDANFNSQPGFNGGVTALTTKNDGRIVVGGAFTLPTRSIAQLRSDGTIDVAFYPGGAANNTVQAVYVQPDGKIIIGGTFTEVDGSPRSRVARFNLNGFVDDTFVPSEITNGTVFALGQQSDGKVVVGGDFRTSDGTNRVAMVRLNTDGSIDRSFQVGTGPNGIVYDIAVQSSDKILLVGTFTTIDGITRNRLGRLTQEGAVDLSFEPGLGADNTVFSAALLPNEDLIIAGDFSLVGGISRNRVARIFAADLAPLEFSGIIVAFGTQPRMTISTVAGRSYVLERTSDLQNWLPITTNAAAGATLELVDPEPATAARRFYRARER